MCFELINNYNWPLQFQQRDIYFNTEEIAPIPTAEMRNDEFAQLFLVPPFVCFFAVVSCASCTDGKESHADRHASSCRLDIIQRQDPCKLVHYKTWHRPFHSWMHADTKHCGAPTMKRGGLFVAQDILPDVVWGRCFHAAVTQAIFGMWMPPFTIGAICRQAIAWKCTLARLTAPSWEGSHPGLFLKHAILCYEDVK